MTGAPAPLRFSAPLTCPACGCTFTGRWVEGAETADQRCRHCGHIFAAVWSGFPAPEPETVIVRPSAQEPGHDAA